MLEILLAVLSGSAAVGMRIALPLLVIAIYSEALWARIPLLSQLAPPIVFGILASWSILELVASKDRLGQRLLQALELVLSPVIGALVGIAIAKGMGVIGSQVLVLAALSGVFALVLQLLQVGWTYRLRRVPLWILFGQDLICVILTLFAFGAPKEGGLIALLMLWLAIRSAVQWQRWYREGRKSKPVKLPD
ncbi:DUF4126 domain-containing protein [filamentous cyanobacterium LEGE 11480]|uniref:DUF4126 domain-containing protein n=1 Tax=Romeriopsis navalis LEGE 11480 TaxID=2777977 RepID=A0A928Z4R4_9CYAN|nr:DUF4126 domain-containing protein [Romeriopsis navalis]MBE9032029.1 DUF4126 domain-containing protein [Romeriopsis navalis LEGE 11480]